jgi:UDP-N-acetylmuramoylalanine--D-glutamate ligase
MARSGNAAARLLTARGEEVTAVDSGRPIVDVPSSVRLRLGSDGLAELGQSRALVKSPGVPAQAPVIARARELGIPVMGELELAWRLLPNPWIAVTGTNGKTTTVELIGHIHREASVPVVVAGNVGTPLTSLVGEIDPATVVICEASSFQLEDTIDFAPDAAVLLNMAEDHLDRHGTFDDYRAAKLKIFEHQSEGAIALTPSGPSFATLPGNARQLHFGPGADSIVSEHDGSLCWGSEPLLATDQLPIRGSHNRENAMAAAAVCLARGISADAVRKAMRTFPGVAHRLELAATVDGVSFVNDSKATNVGATLVALAAYADRPLHLILGGRGKGQDFSPLCTAMGGVRGVYLIGEEAFRLRATLAGTVPIIVSGTLDKAVEAARSAALPGEAVLFSPACASFDQFENFEDRGEAFRALL